MSELMDLLEQKKYEDYSYRAYRSNAALIS